MWCWGPWSFGSRKQISYVATPRKTTSVRREANSRAVNQPCDLSIADETAPESFVPIALKSKLEIALPIAPLTEVVRPVSAPESNHLDDYRADGPGDPTRQLGAE